MGESICVQWTPQILKGLLPVSYTHLVACAGSLLGIALAKPSSFPVGKVNFMQIDPMTFAEFLLANGDENLAQYLEQVDTLEPIPDAFFNPLYEKLKMYYVTGGMPESVLMWTEARDVSAMQEALSGILGAYERDFARHPNLSEFPKISMIWKSVPSQLARENKKFIYKVVKEGARAREYEDALQWLVDARLVHKIYRSSAPVSYTHLMCKRMIINAGIDTVIVRDDKEHFRVISVKDEWIEKDESLEGSFGY